MQQLALSLPKFCSIYLNTDGLPVLQTNALGIPEQIISRRAAVMLLVGSLCESMGQQLNIYSKITNTDKTESRKIFESTRICYEYILRKEDCPHSVTELSPNAIGQLIKKIIKDTTKNESLPPVRMYTPRSLTWIPTYQCSNSCKYCYLLGYKKKMQKSCSPSFMPLERLSELFEEASRIGVYHITITGGEPLDYPHILDCIKTIKNLNIRISLTTKKHLPEDLISFLSQKDMMSISVDSCYPNVVSKMTGNPNAFSAMIQNLANVANSCCWKSVETVVTKINYRHILDTIAYVESQNIDEIHLLRVIRSIYRDFNGLLLSDQEWRFLCHKVIEKYPDLKLNKMSIILVPSESESYWADPAACNEIKYSGVNAKPISQFTCLKLNRDMVFDSSGNVYACYRTPEVIITSLIKSSITKAWQLLKEIAFPTREMYHGTICYDCEYFHKCLDKNRCIYYSLLAYGRCFAPDPLACCKKRACFARDYTPFYNPINHSKA